MSIFARLFNRNTPGVARIRDAEGFRLATDDELYGQFAPLRALANPKFKRAEQLLEWEAQVQPALGAQSRLPDGVPLAAVVAAWSSMPPTLAFEERRDDWVAPFRQAYEERPNVLTASMLATACFDAASDARGVDWAQNVSDKAWASYAKWNAAGVEALNAQSEAGAEDLVWLSTYFAAVQRSDSSLDDLTSAFNRVFAVDPTNLQVLRAHGLFLLPRWHGTDANDLERFARWAASATEVTFGAGAYAYIYGHCATVGALTASETACDPALLDQGYRDLEARFPSPTIRNEHANALAWIGDTAGVQRVFNEGLRAIDPNAWGAQSSKEGIELAVNAFVASRGDS